MKLRLNLAQAFDSIPAATFLYRPTAAQPTIGYVAQHLTNDNYLFCDGFGAMKSVRSKADMLTPDSVKATWPKATLVTKLKESFTFCTAAFAQLDDTKLKEKVTVTDGGVARWTTREGMAISNVTDMSDHYSQIANYMRLNKMVPPTALPRPVP